MTELLEYSLVLMASTLFVAGSVLVYGGYVSFESRLSLRAVFSGVSGLAERAIGNGSARQALALPSAVIGCHSGVLSVRVGGSEENETLKVGCGFSVSVPPGVHTLEFSDSASQLYLAVT